MGINRFSTLLMLLVLIFCMQGSFAQENTIRVVPFYDVDTTGFGRRIDSLRDVASIRRLESIAMVLPIIDSALTLLKFAPNTYRYIRCIEILVQSRTGLIQNSFKHSVQVANELNLKIAVLQSEIKHTSATLRGVCSLISEVNLMISSFREKLLTCVSELEEHNLEVEGQINVS